MLIGIFGTGRNGSTLLGRLLDGLEDTYIHPVEEKFLTVFNDLVNFGSVKQSTQQNCTRRKLSNLETSTISLSTISKEFNNSLHSLYQDFVQNCLETKSVPKILCENILNNQLYTAHDFVEEYLQKIGQIVQSSLSFNHCMFKTIETPYISEYVNLFPNMRFIHIVRDPVTTCSSQKRSLMENKRLPASYLGYDWLVCMLNKRWIPHVNLINTFKEDERHIVVRYEDLVVNAEFEIQRISTWLKLNAPPRPKRLTIFNNCDLEQMGGNPSKKGLETPTEVIKDLQKKNDYREILTNREINLIELKVAKYATSLGYFARKKNRFAIFVHYLLLDKWDFMHCNSITSYLKGVLGVLYRRASIFFN